MTHDNKKASLRDALEGNTQHQEHAQENSAENVTQLQEIVLKMQSEIEELQDQLVRAVAESQNMRKRLEKQAQETKQYAISQFAKELMEVVDNLDRAVDHADSDQSNSLGHIAEGVRMTQAVFQKVLEKNQVHKVSPEVGQAFDYKLHHAISQVEDDSKEPGTIVSVMQAGYTFYDRLLRPALVVVTKNAD